MNYFEGDVLTTDDQMIKLNRIMGTYEKPSTQPQPRGLVKYVRWTWKDGIVLYTINENVGESRVSQILMRKKKT